MRVICITLQNFTGCPGLATIPMEVGDEFNVVGEVTGYTKYGQRIPCYDLEPWANTGHVFDQRNFAPLDPNLDETELVNEEFEEKYCVPVNSNVCE